MCFVKYYKQNVTKINKIQKKKSIMKLITYYHSLPKVSSIQTFAAPIGLRITKRKPPRQKLYRNNNSLNDYLELQRMHVLSKRAPNRIGPGMPPKTLTRSIWSPNAYDR